MWPKVQQRVAARTEQGVLARRLQQHSIVRGYMTRDEKVAVVEKYVYGLGNGDLTGVPFADCVRFHGPLTDLGKDAVDFLSGLLPSTSRRRRLDALARHGRRSYGRPAPCTGLRVVCRCLYLVDVQ